MRHLLLMFVLTVAPVTRVSTDNINEPKTPEYKHIPSTYNSVLSQTNENKPNAQATYASPSLHTSPATIVSLVNKSKNTISENKHIIPSLNNLVSNTSIIRAKSAGKSVHNSVITNSSNLKITPDISKSSVTETGDSFDEQSESGDVLTLPFDIVKGVLGGSLSFWNHSAESNDGKSLDDAFQFLEEFLALIEGARNASVRLTLWPGTAVEVEQGINGSLSLGIKSDETTADARGTSLRKRFDQIFPFLLVPPLIMSAILPFVLPAMKLMAVAAGALNQLALAGAVLTIMRNHAFWDPPRKKVIYVNKGYKNDPHLRPADHNDEENSHHRDLHFDEDLKKYEEFYHGSYPQPSYGEDIY